MTPRPVSVTLLAWVLIAAGAVGLVYHFSELNLRQLLQNDTLWVELVRGLAIIAGVFLLRGSNWARWLALAWIGFHVVISVFHSWPQVVMHAIILIVFAYILFRPSACQFFRPAPGSTP